MKVQIFILDRNYIKCNYCNFDYITLSVSSRTT